MTSTLQQEAGRKLGFGSARTMRAAQRLYENGFITYMRTDSTTLSAEAVATARRVAAARFGSGTVPSQPRSYANKVKNAQEAHEAIRPAGDAVAPPGRAGVGAERRRGQGVRPGVAAHGGEPDDRRHRRDRDHPADRTGRDRRARSSSRRAGRSSPLPASDSRYVEATDDDAEGQRQLPPLREGAEVDVRSATASGHETNPPARYTEATLVRRLEELGVGRPSTYASIMETIQDRGYVWKRGSALIPAFVAMATVGTAGGPLPRRWWTTPSRRGWRTTSTPSPPATRSRCRGSVTSTSGRVTPPAPTPASSRWCRTTSAPSTRARSTRSRSA